jgi:hypothetical protein
LKQYSLLPLFLLPLLLFAQYKGSGYVTRGKGQTDVAKLMDCVGGRTAALGHIKDSLNQVWTLPALVSYSDMGFPFASDLYNSCNGKTFANTQSAIAGLNGKDIISIDADGEVITAYIFADNYFEMYINGVPVGKDPVPFTEFNSSIVRFRVKRPFTIAMLLVDWEEALGLGTELNGGFAYHPGDGGMVALFTDSNNQVVAKTGSDWKAQTYYTAPVKDLSCPTEQGNLRLSDLCNTASENDGSNWYALHWKRPALWFTETYSDTSWPAAKLYTNTEIGVNNKPAYTRFLDVFDRQGEDAQFIWSSNVILDNEVLVRYMVPAKLAGVSAVHPYFSVSNPSGEYIRIFTHQNGKYRCTLFDGMGRTILNQIFLKGEEKLDVSTFANGTYILHLEHENGAVEKINIVVNHE